MLVIRTSFRQSPLLLGASGEATATSLTPALEDTTGHRTTPVELGKLGGKKGGKARAEKLSPERRKEIASKAAKARWDKKRREEESS